MNKQAVLQNLGDSYYRPVLVAKNQSVSDIIKLIKHKHEKCAADYDKIAGFFWKGNIRDTCEGLFDFCKANIPYEVESEDIQTVPGPARILSKPGDCKHYSLFCAGVLDALCRQGRLINWAFRFASYNPFDDTPGHVFVVVNTGGREIWIDPVLDEFDYHKIYTYAVDKKMSGDKKEKKIMSGMVLNRRRVGLGLSKLTGVQILQGVGTTAQTGVMIEKISAAVATVPVYPVSTIIGAAGAVVGFFLATFGSRYSSSSGVRWLTQLFEYYTMGNCSSHSDNTINEANVPTAQKWFSVVLGVPIYDRYRFNTLKGSAGQSYAQRANAFLMYPDVVKAGVTYDQAYEAAQISDSLSFSAPCGGWKGMTAAPSLIDTTGAVTTGSAGGGLFGNIPKWMIWVGGGLILYFILTGNKKS